MRMVKAGRVLTLAAVAALAVPGVSLAAAHGTAQARSSRPGGLPSAAGTNNAVFQATIEAVSYSDI